MKEKAIEKLESRKSVQDAEIKQLRKQIDKEESIAEIYQNAAILKSKLNIRVFRRDQRKRKQKVVDDLDKGEKFSPKM